MVFERLKVNRHYDVSEKNDAIKSEDISHSGSCVNITHFSSTHPVILLSFSPSPQEDMLKIKELYFLVTYGTLSFLDNSTYLSVSLLFNSVTK